jgi:hypothetical protein
VQRGTMFAGDLSNATQFLRPLTPHFLNQPSHTISKKKLSTRNKRSCDGTVCLG